MNDLTVQMPKMMMGRELEEAMLSLPLYDPAICQADAAARLVALNDMMGIYVPSAMSYEIYSKIYLSMLHSLRKKQTVEAVRQGNQNFRRIQGLGYSSVLGGADSFSIIGPSGIGKSTALAKAIALSGGEQIIMTKEPYAQIIPCINVQCPHDCSVKGLLLAILSQVDVMTGSGYQYNAVKDRASIDSLIGTVSQVALNNILLIVIDECQNICRNKNGVNLVASMTQLINSSGVSICMVGLPETEIFFGQEMQLARRSVGLSYTALPYDNYFMDFCATLFSYQYTAKRTKCTPELTELLYECSGGIIAILVSLIMEAQQTAILSGIDELCKETILTAYQERFKNVQDFVHVNRKKRSQTSFVTSRKAVGAADRPIIQKEDTDEASFAGLAAKMGEMDTDIISFLSGYGIHAEEAAV